jgi:hypothetical protein
VQLQGRVAELQAQLNESERAQLEMAEATTLLQARTERGTAMTPSGAPSPPADPEEVARSSAVYMQLFDRYNALVRYHIA